MRFGTDHLQVAIQLTTAVTRGVGLAAVAMLQTRRPFGTAHLHDMVRWLVGFPALGLAFFLFVQAIRTTVVVTDGEIEFRLLGRLCVRRVPIGEYQSIGTTMAFPVAGVVARMYFRTRSHAGLVGLSAYELAALTSHLDGRRGEFCRHCGYDLRTTPDRCPECGTATGHDG